MKEFIGFTENGFITAIYCALLDSLRIKGKQTLLSDGAVESTKGSLYFYFAPEVQQAVTGSEERPGRNSCGTVKVEEFYFGKMLLGTSPPLILITAHQGALKQQRKMSQAVLSRVRSWGSASTVGFCFHLFSLLLRVIPGTF